MEEENKKLSIKDLFEGLNSEQKAAILNNDKPLRIIAGAGSGKTRVISTKIIYLIEELKIPAKKILALTFTNKAAAEMKSRVIDIIGNDGLDTQISTFHSLCSKFLRIEIHNLNYPSKFVILSATDQIYILKNIYKDLEISNSIISYSSILNYISSCKVSFKSPISERELANNDTDLLKIDIYEKYLEEIKERKYLDFDDLLIITNKILNDFPQICQKWALKFDYILIDEFQDTSLIQYNIIKQLSNKKNITIVGDPDQTIYSWRGANIDLINNFHHDFPNTITITMDTNYRSTKNILEAANKLIHSNTDRLPKFLKTNDISGENIEFFYAYSQEAEARWVVNKINELKKLKIQLKDIAIFYRSNFYSRSIESSLISELINHKVLGGKKFFELSEIKDVISFLWVLSKETPQIHLQRILNIPSRKIGPATETKLINFAIEKKESLYDVLIKYYKVLPVSQEIKIRIVTFLNQIRKHKLILEKGETSIVKILESFLNSINYLSTIKSTSFENDSKFENVMELFKSIENWEVTNPKSTLEDYLEEISLMNESSISNEESINSVTLMTIHAAKGLEFKNVFLIGLNEDVFPSTKITQMEDGLLKDQKMEEERRLAYVAITRAKERLFISGSRGSSFIANVNQQKSPSRFIAEMGIDVSSYANGLLIIKNFKNDIKINKNYIIGDIINHITFGKGVVLDLDGDKITIKFDNNLIGIKQFLKNHKSIERVV